MSDQERQARRRGRAQGEPGDPGDPGDPRVLYRAAFIGGEDEGSELKEVEYDSLEEALENACRDLRAGYRPIGIWAADRTLLHSAASIRARCRGAG